MTRGWLSGSSRMILFAVALSAMAVVAGTLGYLLWAAHQRAAVVAVAHAGNVVRMVASDLTGALRDAGLALHQLATVLVDEKGSGSAGRDGGVRRLAAALDRHSSLKTIQVVDASGAILLRAGVAGRDQTAPFSRECRPVDGRGIGFPPPVDMAGPGQFVLLCVPLERENGAGPFLVAVVSLDRVRDQVRRLDLGVGGRIDIHRLDDMVPVARWPMEADEEDGVLRARLREALARGERTGTLTSESMAGGSRVVGFRVSDEAPFVVSVAMTGSGESSGAYVVLICALVAAMAASLWWLYRRLNTTGRLLNQAHHGLVRHEERLRVSESKLREAMDVARMAYWEFDIDSGRVGFSDRLLALMKVSADAIGGYWVSTESVVRDLVHGDDGSALLAEFRRCRQVADRHRVFSAEARLCCGDGVYRWFSLRFHYVQAKNDLGARIVGAAVDIDDTRRAQDQLRLLARVFEHSGEAIVVTDADNAIISVNQAFSRLTGYGPDEVRGRNPRVLSAGRMTHEGYQDMWRSINEKGRWEGEIWDKRKDGTCYPKWLTISTMRDDAGRITHYIGSFTDISERKTAEERIYHLAHHDTLTGLPNRFSLHNRLSQAIASVRREDKALAVMFLDLDHFKAINDTLGHPIGDRLLVDVAQRLKSCVRESDVVARLGGDEFVVVMTDIGEAPLGVVAAMSSKILQRLDQAYVIDGHELNATPSIGIAVFPEDGEDADTLMKNADVAMYHAKSHGRRNFQFFTTTMNEAAAERVELETALRHAIDDGQLVLHYQPQIDAVNAHVVGVEALVRWLHPERGMVPPDKFIPLAEETGLIEPLGRWVLGAACRELSALRRGGHANVRMAINLSARQLRHEPLVEHVGGLMREFGLGQGDLELEITETAAMENPQATVAVLKRLRELGVELAIDDFGTGYSSLGYLKLLPIQRLKLDRSFVRDLENDHNDAIICSATIALAHSLGLEVVAEGVETDAQLTYLKYLGCDIIQGYLFSKPLPGDRLEDYLRDYIPKGK